MSYTANNFTSGVSKANSYGIQFHSTQIYPPATKSRSHRAPCVCVCVRTLVFVFVCR